MYLLWEFRLGRGQAKTDTRYANEAKRSDLICYKRYI